MMWVQVYQSKDKEMAELILAALKEKFQNIPLKLSSVEGKPNKITFEGMADERPLVEYANKFEKEYLKQKTAAALAESKQNLASAK